MVLRRDNISGMLDRCSQYHSASVRYAVASAPHLLPATQIALALDLDPLVREALAGNIYLARERFEELGVLDLLAQDECEEVRLAVALNPSAATSTVLGLQNDRSPRVAAAAGLHPAALAVSLN